MTRRTFQVDRTESKLMGVCSGLANLTGVDATVIRIGFVVATLIGGWPWTVVAYFVLAMAGKPQRVRGRHARTGLAGPHHYRSGDVDRRLAEIETYVAGNDSRLAREIEELR